MEVLSSAVLLASSLSGTGYWIVVAAWLVFCLVLFLFSRRDTYGRTRARGCIIGFVLFFGLFVVAFAGWAARHIF